MIEPGQPAPDFTASTDSGGLVSSGSVTLSDLAGRAVVLYFYPKDMTPGCTTEACDFRDAHPDFSGAGAVVLGVSKDSAARHDKFRAKHSLPFTLVADEDGAICQAYGVWQLQKFMGREAMGIVRATFLIDTDGVVQKVWPKVRVKGHVQDVLDAVKALGVA